MPACLQLAQHPLNVMNRVAVQRPKVARHASSSAMSPQAAGPRTVPAQSPSDGAAVVGSTRAPAASAVRDMTAPQVPRATASRAAVASLSIADPVGPKAEDPAEAGGGAEQLPAQTPADEAEATSSSAGAVGQSAPQPVRHPGSVTAKPAEPATAPLGQAGATTPGPVPQLDAHASGPAADASDPTPAAAHEPASASARQASAAVAEAIARAAEAAGVPASDAADTLSGVCPGMRSGPWMWMCDQAGDQGLGCGCVIKLNIPSQGLIIAGRPAAWPPARRLSCDSCMQPALPLRSAR